MKTALLATLTFAASMLASHSARAQSFTPNHLWVGGKNGKLVEFDTARTPVRTLSGPADAHFSGLAFGPDGDLYAADRAGGRLFAIDASGEFELLRSGLRETEQIMFREDGVLVIPQPPAKLLLFRRNGLSSEVFLPTSSANPLFNPKGMAMGTQGHKYMTSAAGVHELDADGRVVRTIGRIPQLEQPGAIAVAPNGNLLVCDTVADGKVVELSPNGALIAERGQGFVPGGARGIAFGPDGKYYASAFGGKLFTQFAPDGTVIRGFDLGRSGVEEPGMIAFAPFRFQAKIKGQLTGAGRALSRAKDRKATLSLTPGLGTAMLQLGGDLTGSLQREIVLRGFEGQEDLSAKKRMFAGLALEDDPTVRGGASLTLILTGSVDADGNYVIKKAAGSLASQDTAHCFLGKLTARKRVR